MSNSPSGVVPPDFATSSVAKHERMLDGFPWVSAIVLYTLSWGWSLLRPNTLYWDDWAYIFNRTKSYLNQIFIETGLPPYRALIDQELLAIGYWTVHCFTFLMFFVTGTFLWEILKKTTLLRPKQIKFIVLIFLTVPVNHARIALVMFGYSTSFLLLFLAWFLLIRFRSNVIFVLSVICFFWSFMTHSFLFFVLLPFLHFCWLNKTELLNFKELTRQHLHLSIISLLPLIYLVARSVFWSPTENYQTYQQPTSAGLITGSWLILFGLIGLSIIVFRHIKKKPTHFGFVLLVSGFLITALALFPYFAAELYVGYAGRPAFITVLEFRADWRSRHQLLMPLGLALGVLGVNELLKWRGKNLVVSVVLVISVALNMFWGSQYFLQSLKQEQLVELFKSTKGNLIVASVGDSTLRFNGRENDFRGYEWNGFMTLAGIPTDRPGCEALPNGSIVNLKSDKPYLSALISRDLDLYFDVTPCSEVLAQNG